MVVGGDDNYILRDRIRWYARTYGMAPHVVAREVPIEDLLLDYWESHYKDLRDSPDPNAQQDLVEEQRLLTMTAADLAAEARAEEDEEARSAAELARWAAEDEDDTPPRSDPNPLGDDGGTGLPDEVDIKFDLGLADDPRNL